MKNSTVPFEMRLILFSYVVLPVLLVQLGGWSWRPTIWKNRSKNFLKFQNLKPVPILPLSSARRPASSGNQVAIR